MQQLATVTSNGAAVTYDNGIFAVGGETVGVEKVIEYDKLGVLTWANDETRAWAYQTAASAPTAPQPTAVAQPVSKEAEPSKPVYKKWWFWVVVATLLIVGCGFSSCVAGMFGMRTTGTSTSAPGTVGESTDGAATTPNEPAAEPAPEQEQPKAWTQVIELKGNANKASAPFELTGGSTRLRYTVGGGDMVVAAFYVMKEGTSLQEDGGLPEVMVSEAGSDETYMTKKAGTYYLDVQAANCDWIVTIEEER